MVLILPYVVKRNKMQYLCKFEENLILFALVRGKMCQKMTKNSFFGNKNGFLGKCYCLKNDSSFLFLRVVCVPARACFPDNVKSFGAYPCELEGQNCQKRKKNKQKAKKKKNSQTLHDPGACFAWKLESENCSKSFNNL